MTCILFLSGSTLADQFDCRPKDDLTVMSVMLEAHLPTLEAKGRVKVLRTAMKHFGIKQVSDRLTYLLHIFTCEVENFYHY